MSAAEGAPLAVGLVGAGPWAGLVHAPMLAAGPETRLAGVWARRPEAAAELAARHGAVPYGSYDELVDACEAVAFAVPPGVQADLAPRAAVAGRALLLEKPIAADLAAAERLAEVVAGAGVATMVVLSWRYSAPVRRFLEQAAGFAAAGGRGLFVSGGLLGGMFATPWRLERGALLDLGPHVVDLLDAALGPVMSVRARGDSLGWVSLLLEHESGVVSEAGLCATSGVSPSRAGVELYGREGVVEVDCSSLGASMFDTVRRELAAAVASGDPHPLDVHRGLHLQRIIADAEHQLASAP